MSACKQLLKTNLRFIMNRQKFHKSLNTLSGWRERAFILALAERALPNASLYFESIENAAALPQNVIDKAWHNLIASPNEEGIIALLDRVVAAIKLTEEPEHYGALPTRDCLQVFEQALLAGINSEKKRALDASQKSLETITDFIEFSEGEDCSENQLIKLFDKHPLVEREFSFQMELSDMLRSEKNPGNEFIRQIRELAQDEGVSNIGISL